MQKYDYLNYKQPSTIDLIYRVENDKTSSTMSNTN